MKFSKKKYGLFLLFFTMVAMIFSGSRGCARESEVIDEPYVRLMKNETIKSEILDRSINYAVLLPENYNTSTDSFPVVYLLHGFGDDESAWYSGGRINYYSDKFSSEISPMIFVMPEGFNSYYVNKHNGKFAYMDMFTEELVPAIDSLFRTKADKSQRAVMGYSMGGYGALILPVLNPDLFSVSVPLSMSFRTDEQYLAEPESVFDYQWGSIFGGTGTKGNSRLTEYFRQNSPFYFFNGGETTQFNELKIFIDCGDDEESLSVTNSALHCLMRDNEIRHEYRVSDGTHSWDYWHNSLHEALLFINSAFQGTTYPDNPENEDVGASFPAGNMEIINITGTDLEAGVLLPPGYEAVTGNYPVLYLIHDFKSLNREEKRADLFSLLFNSMLSTRLTKSLLIEIPFNESLITGETIKEIILQVDTGYATRKQSRGRILAGNSEGAGLAAKIIVTDTVSFASCCLFNAFLSEGTTISNGNIFYYLDECDEGKFYQEYNGLYVELRKMRKEHEYRVRQGNDSYQDFLNGLSNSMTVLKKRLTLSN